MKYLLALFIDPDADLDDQVHGSLNQIYEDVRTMCNERGWDSVDAVIMGGDFQVRLVSYPKLKTRTSAN